MSLDPNIPHLPNPRHTAKQKDTGLPAPIIFLIGLMVFFGAFVALIRLT